jgi:hypothetical protein
MEDLVRKDGLIEFEGYLINPHLLGGAVVWETNKAASLGINEVARVSNEILARWRQNPA